MCKEVEESTDPGSMPGTFGRVANICSALCSGWNFILLDKCWIQQEQISLVDNQNGVVAWGPAKKSAKIQTIEGPKCHTHTHQVPLF